MTNKCWHNAPWDSLARENTTMDSARLKLILDVNNSIASNLELQDLLRSISASVRRAVRCDAAAVSVFDPDANQLRVCAMDFPSSQGFAQEGLLIPLDRTPLGEAFKSGKPFIRVRWEDETDAGATAGRAEGIQTGCGFPLFNQGRKPRLVR